MRPNVLKFVENSYIVLTNMAIKFAIDQKMVNLHERKNKCRWLYNI